MNTRLFWKSLVVQGLVLALPFAVLALTLDDGFFEDWGWLTGPLVWLACSAATARILSLPLGYVMFAALAGGVAGAIVLVATSHWPAMAAALLVFAAACGSYDSDAEAEAQREWTEGHAATRRSAAGGK